MGTRTNAIGYATFDTPGNASDFGDLTLARKRLTATSNLTRAVFIAGNYGSGNGTRTDVIDYVTIDTLGNATDFGDMGKAVQLHGSTSGAAS